MPDLTFVDHIESCASKRRSLCPMNIFGDVLKLLSGPAAECKLTLTYAGSRAMVVYDLPLNESSL